MSVRFELSSLDALESTRLRQRSQNAPPSPTREKEDQDQAFDSGQQEITKQEERWYGVPRSTPIRSKLGPPQRVSPLVQHSPKPSKKQSRSKSLPPWKRQKGKVKHPKSKSSRNRTLMKPEERKAWDDSISDLTKYKLSQEELAQQHLIHTSPYDRTATKRLERQGISPVRLQQTLQSILSPPWRIKPPPPQPHREREARDAESEEAASQLYIEKERKERELLKRLVDQVRRFEKVSGRGSQLESLDSVVAILDTERSQSEGEVREEEGNIHNEDGEVDNGEVEKQVLFKLCTRVVNHLAGCERDFQLSVGHLRQSRETEKELRKKLEDLEEYRLVAERKERQRIEEKEEMRELEERCKTLQKENVSLKAMLQSQKENSHPGQYQTQMHSPLKERQQNALPIQRLSRANRKQNDQQEREAQEQQVEMPDHTERISRRYQLMAKWRALENENIVAK